MKTKFLLFSLMLSLLSITNLWAEDVVYKTALFGSSYNSKGVSGYTDMWSSTNGDFTVNLTNFNNNNNGWNYVKCGRKNNASVGSITTSSIDKAITKVNVTVDACTASEVNSFTLYVASNLEFTADLQTIPVIISTGVKTFTVTTPTANCYYKLVVDCASGSSNGLVTISKVEYYKAEDATPTCATPTFTPAGGITFYGSQDVELASTTSGAAIHYTLDGSDPTSSSSTYSAPINLTNTTTIKAIAIKNGMEDSEISSATYTAGEAVTSYDIDFETNNLEAYVNWEFNNIACATNTITAHQGDYYGNTGGKASASITTRAKYANPGIFSFYTSKESGNTTASTWSVQVSEDGEEWTEVESFDATTGSKGTWTEREADLSAYTNVFIRVLYSGSTAIRAIDDISLEEASSVAKPTIIGTDKFLTSSEITITQDEADAIYYTTNGNEPTTSSTKYTVPFFITETTTVKAIAVKGTDVSAVAEQTYTKISTISVAEALTATTGASVYVQGTITSITEVNLGYKNATYVISDISGGIPQNEMIIYRGKYVGGADFTSLDQIHVGDVVIVSGTIGVYNEKNQLAQGNQIETISAPAVAALVFTPDGGGFMGETDVTITCATTGNTIYYTTDETAPSKSSTQYTGAIHINATTTIKAIAYVGEESSLVITKTFTLTAPMTVAEALAALDVESSISNAAVAGIVCSVTSISSGHATYYISDDGVATGDKLEVYNGYGLNGESFADGGIQVGDQVTVFGDLTVYQSTTKEFSAGSRLLTFNRPTISVTGVTLPATASVKVGKTITLTPTIEPASASNKNVTWSITSGSDYASVSEEGVVTGLAAGEAVIQVTTEDGGYTATCTVTVAEAPDFNDPTHEWRKITSADKLVVGKYYVLGLAGQAVTATFNLTGGYLGKVASTFTQGAIIAYDALGENTAVFQLDGEAGAWTLNEVMAQDQLLGGYGTANLAWGGENTAWPITFTEGFAVIGDANGNRILYNKTSPRFKTYSSDLSTSMLLPQLFVWGLKSHMVAFDANGGVAESVPEAEPTEDGKITIPATEPTHEDVTKVFVGWYVESAPDVLYKSGDEFATDEDVTLYAKWNTAPTYTVTYVLGGSGTAPEVTSYPVGKKVTIATISDLKNPGYLFSGWTVEDAEHNVLPVDENSQFVMPSSNVKVIAKWARATNDKWVLVTDVTNLKTDGTKYLIASAEEMTDGKYYAMAEQKSNNRAAVEVMHSEGIIRGSAVLADFVLEDAENGMFAIKMSDGYLYTAANNNNYLRTQTENNVNGKWTITIEDGVASIVATNSSNRKVMQFNYASNNQIFSCYGSASQKPLALYEKAPMVEINDGETVQASTAPGADIVIYDGGTLAVDDDATIGDLTVEEGGKVTLTNKKLTVTGTFAIETTMGSGKSGELSGVNGSNFAVTGEAYIDITLGDNGNADKWHAFTVPFPVDALNGIFDLNGNKLTNEQNYAIMDYHGDIRAEGKYGWKKFRGALVPGTFYLMTVDGNRTTYRMKIKAGSTVVADNSKAVTAYDGAGEDTDKGWNGIGNPTLAYGQVGVAVQVLNPQSYTYETMAANSCNFIIGTPFFYQAAADGSIEMQSVSGTAYYAPIRKAVKTTEQIKVSLANENYTDNLFISASEDATNNYQIGKDLVKMTMTNTPIVPQIFGVAYKTQLSMVHAPLVGDRATYTLNLYAPTDGEYTISAQQTEDAIVYLTYEGSPIWNITAGEYNCDLQKGNNSGFGLMLVRRAPQVTTDIEGANQSQTGVRKLLINGQLLIEKDGKLFNVTGERL